MSLGLLTLRALIDTNGRSTFRKLSERLFLEEELPAFNFCASHLRRYNKLPSVGACKSHGHELPVAKEPASYYVGRMHDRAVFNITNEHQTLLARAMKAQDAQAIINVYRSALSATMGVNRPEHYTSLGDASGEVVATYDRAYLSEGLQGVPFGWPTLDELTLGAMPGELAILVSRPWMGKTFLLVHSAIQAWRAAHSVVVVSMEMLTTPLVRRWIGVDQSLNPRYIKMGRLSRWSENRLRATVEDYRTQAPVHFVSGNFEKSVTGVEQVVALLRPDIVYIDAGYLLSPGTSRRFNATHEMLSQVVKDLKVLATTHSVPLFVTVQFNRNATVSGKRGKGSRLDLKDIGGTDAVGQDADIVLGLRKPSPPFTETKRIIETMKIRDGEIKDFATNFTFEPMRFDECSMEGLDRTEESAGVNQEPADLTWMI